MSIAKDSPSVNMNKLKRFWLNTKRVFKIAHKPSAKEYWGIVKVCLIGLAIIGTLSYVIQLISNVISNNV